MTSIIPIDPNFLQLDQLYDHLTDAQELSSFFERVRLEDLGPAGLDITTHALVDPSRSACADVIARQPGMIAGLRALPHLIDAYFGKNTGATAVCETSITALVEDGFEVNAGDAVVRLTGSLAQILMIERPLLNLLSRLCGIATLTRNFVDEIDGCQGHIYDTRKTTPGLRHLEKYAVRCGGGRCHRVGLYDAILVKDNHIAGIETAELTAFLTERIAPLRDETSKTPLAFVEVEVDTLEQLEAVLSCPTGLVDIALLDNMNLEMLCDAVAMRERMQPKVELEASGGVSLSAVRSIAITGMDRISVGALTHSAIALDLGLDIAT